jgi:hypothetical protein
MTKTIWDEYEEQGHNGLLKGLQFADGGFITPFELARATNQEFGTTYTSQDGYDKIPNTTVQLWDRYEGWAPFHYVTREDAREWIKAHRVDRGDLVCGCMG